MIIRKEDIQHGFPKRAHDLAGLFDGTNKIATFVSKLEKQSLVDPDRYDPDKYKGDGFEFLVEVLLKTHSCDNRLGITSYEPIQKDDTGVDGIGFNQLGEKCVVQVKFRGNNQQLLTANKDHLSNMFSSAQTRHDVSTISSEIEMIRKNADLIGEKKAIKKIQELEKHGKVKRHYVITTAEGLHNYTDAEMYNKEVICIGYTHLRALLDDNLSFWNACRALAADILKK